MSKTKVLSSPLFNESMGLRLIAEYRAGECEVTYGSSGWGSKIVFRVTSDAAIHTKENWRIDAKLIQDAIDFANECKRAEPKKLTITTSWTFERLPNGGCAVKAYTDDEGLVVYQNESPTDNEGLPVEVYNAVREYMGWGVYEY